MAISFVNPPITLPHFNFGPASKLDVSDLLICLLSVGLYHPLDSLNKLVQGPTLSTMLSRDSVPRSQLERLKVLCETTWV